ncbi:alpha/beta hydrolase [Streptomyces sp. NPDC021020]|uniref:alpha/beta hydrolase n=1 Tax=Streptomyces sp. NPDC021020 TaxID=3365109 RepID=UPI0037AF09C6
MMEIFTTELVEGSFHAASASRDVDFRVLAPADRAPGERLPLVLHLHGAMSSAASLEQARPLYDEAIARGAFPRAVVACASTPTRGGFYVDGPGGRWEAVVGADFPAHLAARFGPLGPTALIGASMGGYGALKLAFAEPERYAAVAALSPVVFPGETPDGVPARALPSLLGELHEAMSLGSGDPATYAANSVYGRARAHADRIRAARLPVLVDCGGADEFRLYEGAEYLHGVLDGLAVEHTYRLVPGAGHVGPESAARTADAIAFVGRALG